MTGDSSDPGPPREALPFLFGLICVLEGGLVLVAWGLGWLFGVDPFAYMVADARAVLQGVLATLPMLLMLWWGLSRPRGAVGQVTRQGAELAQKVFPDTSSGGLALVSLLAGLGEEALFRGFLQPLLGGIAGEPFAIVVAGAAFGVVHAMSRAYALIATVIGIYLGVVYALTDNLMVPIVAHALYDFVALLWLQRARLPRQPGA